MGTTTKTASTSYGSVQGIAEDGLVIFGASRMRSRRSDRRGSRRLCG
jgi:hypothetical protein